MYEIKARVTHHCTEHFALRHTLKSCTDPFLYRSDLVTFRSMLYLPDVCNCTMPYVHRTVPAYAVRYPAQIAGVVALTLVRQPWCAFKLYYYQDLIGAQHLSKCSFGHSVNIHIYIQDIYIYTYIIYIFGYIYTEIRRHGRGKVRQDEHFYFVKYTLL